MKNSIFQTALTAVFGFLSAVFMGPPLKRARTRDVAFGFRMGAGFPGDVNRMHPASILPQLIDTTYPPAAYGGPVLVNSAGNGVRGLIAADGSTTALPVFGFLVRPFPTQQLSLGNALSTAQSGSQALGAAVPPVVGVCDVLREGYIMVQLPAGATVVKGGLVYAWAAASAGSHVQGQCEAAASSTNTITMTNAYFTGAADALGNAEVEMRAA